mmetsp:Transcript_6214/g.15376  ORF Transcript_6214/g.15376 Transcript_6214/m.15376 type:complete len:418 (-) Transcript_6214:46-1299(-)
MPSEEITTMAEPAIPVLEVDFHKNVTDLYQAITKSDWTAAIQAVKKHPDEAKTWVVRRDEEKPGKNTWRFLPIHSACARRPPATLVTALIAAYPEGARCVDDQGMYALHYASGNQASREVMRSLLMAFPDAAKLKDPRGMLPIHYLACWGPSSISVVDMVMVANRNIGDCKDEDGKTPMELAKTADYPEKSAVIAALRRWSNTTGEKKDPILLSTPRFKGSDLSMNLDYKVIGSKFLSVDTEEEKKSDESIDGSANPISPTTFQKLHNMDDQISVMEIEAKEDKLQISMLQYELKQRNEIIQKLRRELELTNDECNGLRRTLADVTEQHEDLAGMNSSLFAMVEQQGVVLNATRAREEQWEKLASLRRERLHELVQMEEEDTYQEVELRNTLAQTAHEMEAIREEMTTALGGAVDEA